MRKEILKKEIADYSRRLKELGFLSGFSGNISAKVSDKNFLITASGIDKGNLSKENICEMDVSGKVLSAKKPSSEWRLHAFIYKNFPKVNAVIHTHPPFISVFSCSKIKIDKPLMAEFEIMLKKLPKSAYFTPGSPACEKAVARACKTSQTVILANHGLLVYARNLKNAFALTEEAEHFAKIYWLSIILGRSEPIKKSKIPELQKLAEQFDL